MSPRSTSEIIRRRAIQSVGEVRSAVGGWIAMNNSVARRWAGKEGFISLAETARLLGVSTRSVETCPKRPLRFGSFQPRTRCHSILTRRQHACRRILAQRPDRNAERQKGFSVRTDAREFRGLRDGARPAGDLQGLRLADLLGRSRFCRQGPQPYQQRLPDSLGDDWICGVDSR